MPTPRVSVLIDTYNHEGFIEQAILSVLAQDISMSDVEILVVDDGSTDRTPEIVRRFQPRVRLLEKPNGGQASAFNFAIPQCQGEIIAFLDGDDWWAPDKLRRVVQAMTSEPEVGMVGNGIIEVFDNGEQHSEVLAQIPRFRIDSVQGAREGAEFIRSMLIDVPSRAFDDFAGGASDEQTNYRILGVQK